jgi:AraC-like DNA-binding protein
MLETPSVSSIAFTTSDLPKRQQYEAWCGWCDRTFDGSPNSPPEQGFVAESKILRMEGFALARVSTPATTVVRTKTLIRRNPVDHFIITMGRSGKTRLNAEDTTRDVPAGLPFVLSLGHEMLSARGPGDRLQLYLSRDDFPEIAPVLDAARGMVVSGPLGTLLAEFLELLERNLQQIDVVNTASLKDAVGSMIAACIAPSPDRIAAAKSQLDVGRLERVRRVVRQELRSPLLEPALLCRLTGMSRSLLYRLMESQGGVTRFIRRQRLRESHAALCDPIGNKSITAIAEELCFTDASEFSRAFRREFGASPSDMRAAARAGLIPSAGLKASTSEKASTFSDYIQTL